VPIGRFYIPQSVFLWDMPSLTTSHERALTLLFAELRVARRSSAKRSLEHPERLRCELTTTAPNTGPPLFDALNRRHEVYLGKSDDPEVAAQVTALRDKIDVTNSTIASIRLLARAGFATVDRKAYYTLASLHNHGLFERSSLVGSHAYGVLLNAIGVRAVPYATEDVDILAARRWRFPVYQASSKCYGKQV